VVARGRGQAPPLRSE